MASIGTDPFNQMMASFSSSINPPGSTWASIRSQRETSCATPSSMRCEDQRAWTKTDPASPSPFLVHSVKQARHLVEWTVALTPLFALSASSVLDHRLTYDHTGIWARSKSLDLEHAVMAVEGVGAIWLGGRSRIGRTFWQAVDSSVFTAITTTALKYAFSRARPIQNGQPSTPHEFFQGNCCQSFPSGEVALQASFVTPFIAEYYRQDPWVWALEILPLYDAEARMKEQGHWQTDVISGFAIGTAWGIYAHEEKEPFILSVLPGGFMIGLHETF
ncbi:phosphoesterase PA-phosphatase [mine drainage metagenome]|uniref:Phosphoesterase PA-phosphatase n=2 Tax=mine drainage metagenome TaxID=410659 RepID=T1BJF9_9ZZZZ